MEQRTDGTRRSMADKKSFFQHSFFLAKSTDLVVNIINKEGEQLVRKIISKHWNTEN